MDDNNQLIFCRTCMQQLSRLESINLDSTHSPSDVSLRLKLTSCIPELDLDNDSLGAFICNVCVLSLNFAYNFKQQCLKTERDLLERSAIRVRLDPGDVELATEVDGQTKSELLRSLLNGSCRTQKCSLCNFVFYHKNAKSPQCPNCNPSKSEGFTTRKRCKRKSYENYTCDICADVFSSSKDLVTHKEVHEQRVEDDVICLD
uniref:Uncharacterized protein n=1 Tax=Photinus pyralis TaxID=7054 RepID=A0A1Y1L3L2_PHOPY